MPLNDVLDARADVERVRFDEVFERVESDHRFLGVVESDEVFCVHDLDACLG